MKQTPWQYQPASGVWLKRDDLYERAGVRGGKVRTCWQLARRALEDGRPGLVTAGSRSSPQVNIVAQIGRELGLPVRAYVPSGEPLPEVAAAAEAGAEIVAVRPGHNSVIRARAREWAEAEGWAHIPFGMECREAVQATAGQVAGLPERLLRLVVPVGSGMSLAGILWGLLEARPRLPVLGVCVGAWPERRLDTWGPPLWRLQVDLVQAREAYAIPAAEHVYEGVELDPIYEAKCLPYLRPGSGLWLVGIRQTALMPAAAAHV